jgi:myosin heavy subunit
MDAKPKDEEVKVWRPTATPWRSSSSPHLTPADSSLLRTAELFANGAGLAPPQWMKPPVLTSSSTTGDGGGAATAASMEERWDAFQRLAQASEAAFRGMAEAAGRQHAEVAAQQKELAAYQESQNAMSAQQRQHIDQLTRECAQLRQSDASAKEVLAHQADRLVALEAELQATLVRLNQATLAHQQSAQECGRLQESCKAHELHTKELQASLRFADEVVRSMRQTVADCEKEKNEALLEQHGKFEKYRTELTAFYDRRAAEMRDEFTTKVAAMQASMLAAADAREAQLNQSWQETAATLRREYEEVLRVAQQRKAAADTEYRERKEQLEREKEAARVQLRQEAETTELRYRAREEALLDDIAQRERELREREAAIRAVQAQQEQEMQRKMQAREMELRSAHDAALQRMAEQAATEREKLSENFMERLQQLSNAHMQQERELERMHREKEREMAQRYRLNGVDGGDRADVGERRVTAFSSVGGDIGKEALLKRFESVEQRQRERSDKLRSVLSSQEEGERSKGL